MKYLLEAAATATRAALAATATAIVATLCGSGAAAADTGGVYWRDAWRGWHFYEEPDPAEPTEAPPDRYTPPAETPVRISKPEDKAPSEVREFRRLQERLEERRQIAIMNASELNVRRYMELEARVVSMASHFADVAQRIAWSSPDLDPTLQGRPVNAKALEVFDGLQGDQRARTVARLGQDHVVLFFFRSDCPYCHAMAPTLAALQATHGIQVHAVSLDGGTLPGFPHARSDNGIARALRVPQVPAVYLAQPFSGRISPVGFGVLSESQLVERLSVVAESEQSAPPVTAGSAQASGHVPVSSR